MPQDQELAVSRPASSGPLTVVKTDIRENLEKFFNDFDHESFVQVNPNILNNNELKDVFDKLRSEIKTALGAPDDEFYYHVAFFLLRAAIVSTSQKVKYSGSYEYVVNKRKYVVKDSWIFPTVNSLARVRGKTNGLKAFCASLQDIYLAVSRLMPDAFKNRTVGKKGIPSGYEYLSADFLTCTSKLMDDHEKAISLSASKNALDRAASSQADNKLVSLFDLGKYVVV